MGVNLEKPRRYFVLQNVPIWLNVIQQTHARKYIGCIIHEYKSGSLRSNPDGTTSGYFLPLKNQHKRKTRTMPIYGYHLSLQEIPPINA